MKTLLLLPLLFFISATSAKIYQCKDADGRTLFRDDECKENESLVKTVEDSEQAKTFAPNSQQHIYNLVKNSSFDIDLKDWTVPEYTWWEEYRGTLDSGAAIIQAVKPPDDQYIHETSMAQCIPLQGNGEYGLSANVKLDGLPKKASAVRVNLYWYKSLDCKTWGSFATYLEPKYKGEWQHLSREGLTPTMGAVAALVKLTQNGRHSDNGKAIWDNIQFFPMRKTNNSEPSFSNHDLTNLTLGVNLTRNSGFRYDVDGWHVSQGESSWGEWSENAGIGALKATVKSFSKSRGVHIASQCVALGQQRSYTLGARFLRDVRSNQKGGGRLRLTWYSKDDCKGASSPIWRNADPKDIAGWQSLAVDKLIAPAQARAARVELIQSVKGAGKFIGYWDDVVLMAVD
jgi:hypothetical protein